MSEFCGLRKHYTNPACTKAYEAHAVSLLERGGYLYINAISNNNSNSNNVSQGDRLIFHRTDTGLTCLSHAGVPSPSSLVLCVFEGSICALCVVVSICSRTPRDGHISVFFLQLLLPISNLAYRSCFGKNESVLFPLRLAFVELILLHFSGVSFFFSFFLSCFSSSFFFFLFFLIFSFLRLFLSNCML